MARTFITAPEVARLLEYASAESFLRQRERLESDHDFPPPAPLQSRPRKWRREAVELWKARAGHGAADTPAPRAPIRVPAGSNVSLLAAARRP